MSALSRWIWRFRGASCDSSVDEVCRRTNRTLFCSFGTDIDVIRPENFLTEFVLLEKSEG